MRQQRIVEHPGQAVADVGNREHRQRKYPPALLDERHQQHGRHADAEEEGEQALLPRAIIRHRAEDRSERRHDGHGDRRHPRVAGGRGRALETGGGIAGEKEREDRIDDGRLERGVGPVVHRPGADFPTTEAEACEH
jgi:hypothetical protein